MIRMSRVGRKRLLLRAIEAHDRKHYKGALTTPQAAHGAGLMSSSNVLSMLRELEADGHIFEVQIEPNHGCGYTVRAWSKARWETQPLPNRFITIGGVKVNWNTGEVENV